MFEAYMNIQGRWVLFKSLSYKERIAEARDLLHALLKEEALRDAALLVFANKNDFPNAMSVLEITEELEMSSLTQRHWHVQSSCATSGDGLYEGLDWLSNNVYNVEAVSSSEDISAIDPPFNGTDSFCNSRNI
ncbi:ADP-ribosylation factor 2-like [Cryptomeria japonica]|uniref:ADP-ribosylation factor 2-like n=1 Tax=Cryptomeria japonica TaxID=3369 RepID=UPI0027D9D494|nr:ADP-ribosylation factor 2-like [Cryptomeria japonica]